MSAKSKKEKFDYVCIFDGEHVLQKCKIVKYLSPEEVDVEFENGDVSRYPRNSIVFKGGTKIKHTRRRLMQDSPEDLCIKIVAYLSRRGGASKKEVMAYFKHDATCDRIAEALRLAKDDSLIRTNPSKNSKNGSSYNTFFEVTPDVAART